jgi:cellulose 1,4-beta-cellobiosidase
MGALNYYGPSMTVDTSKVFTVVTQFITNDGTTTGTLSEIKRFYVQNGVVIPNSQSTITGVSGNSITDSFCSAQKTAFGDTNQFAAKGGLATMGAALKKGMVLVMSIWDDHTANMLWLDAPYPPTKSASAAGVTRGTCSASSGAPADVEANAAGSSVTFSNIKWGPINSTYTGTLAGGSSSSSSSTKVSTSTSSAKSSTSSSKASTTSTKVSTTTTSTTSSSTQAAQTQYGQCGGLTWLSGPFTCVSPYVCTVLNPYYSQCL